MVRNRESVMDSYHERCISCHRKMIKERKKAGPIKCGDCHVKELESVNINIQSLNLIFLIIINMIKSLRILKTIAASVTTLMI